VGGGWVKKTQKRTEGWGIEKKTLVDLGRGIKPKRDLQKRPWKGKEEQGKAIWANFWRVPPKGIAE